METKHKLLAASYYLGPLGMIAFLKSSDKFEKSHAIQGLSLFYFFILMLLLLMVCLWVVPILSLVALLGILACFFFLGFGWYHVFHEQRMKLPGLEFLSRSIRRIVTEEV